MTCRLMLILATMSLFGAEVLGREPPPEGRSIVTRASVLADALVELNEQTKVFFFWPAEADELTVKPVDGAPTLEAALKEMLAETGLHYQKINENMYQICARHGCNPKIEPFQKPEPRKAAPEPVNDGATAIPEVLVKGSHTLNGGIERSRDHVLPYIVYGRKELESSQAPNVAEFLSSFVTANAGTFITDSKAVPIHLQPVSLNGLGSHQTLVLIDGRRAAGYSPGGYATQPDTAAISLADVERIEVLPASASAIYGGSATGGVVNIVLRTDDRGARAAVHVDRMSHSGVGARRVFGNLGLGSATGDSKLFISASYANQDSVQTEDLGFLDAARVRANDYLRSRSDQRVPPFGSQTNIRSESGSPLFGAGTSSITSVPEGYAGGGGAEPFRANAGLYNLDPTDSAQLGGKRSTVLHGSERKSFAIRGRSLLTPGWEVYGEVSRSETHAQLLGSAFDGAWGLRILANAPNNPFNQNILVTFPSSAGDADLSDKTIDFRTMLGSVVQLPHGWNATIEIGRTGTELRVRRPFVDADFISAVANGTVDVLRGASLITGVEGYVRERVVSAVSTTSTGLSVRAAGSVGESWGGSMMLTASLEERIEKIGEGSAIESMSAGPFTNLTPQNVLLEQRQKITSTYVELAIPLVSQVNERPGIRALDVQASLRADRYRTDAAPLWVGAEVAPESISYAHSRFESANPLIGVGYRPLPGLLLRASYSTAFLPPSVSQLTAPIVQTFEAGSFPDPRRGNERTPELQLTGGGNPALQPEHSSSRSVGFVITPTIAPEFRLSLDYTRIRKRDEILIPTDMVFEDIGLFETLYPFLVMRAPTTDAHMAGPITAIDAKAVNIVGTDVEAWNLMVAQSFEPEGFDKITLTAYATHESTLEMDSNSAMLLKTATDTVRDDFTPLRAVFQLSAQRDRWSFGWTMRYLSKYRVPADFLEMQGSTHVDDSQYHDVFVRYKLGPRGFRWQNTYLHFGIRNIFNETPPFDATATEAGYVSRYGDPRQSTYLISIGTDFSPG
jgi:iron complex outermembrane receptor protein